MFQNYYNFKIVRTEHGAQELKKPPMNIFFKMTHVIKNHKNVGK